MKTRYFYIVLACVGTLAFVMTTGFVTTSFSEITYQIEDDSKLFIAGTTNVNSFECKCTEKFTRTNARVGLDPSSNVLYFDKAAIVIKTSSLDCDNETMNEDLQEAMKAENYPTIRINLHSATVEKGDLEELNSHSTLKVNTTLSITGINKNIFVPVEATRLSQNKFRFVGAITIKLTDYGIEPPTAFFGLVKVRNNIKINLDIVASKST